MTSITSMSSAASAYSVPPRRQDPMAAVTTLLGGDKDALVEQLKSGKSLDDIATAQGVSHEDLVAAIAQGAPPGATDALDRAEEIASTKGMPPPPPGGPGGAGGTGGTGGGAASGLLAGSTTSEQQERLDALSSLLGTDSSDLLDQLLSGTSIEELAAGSGVSADAVGSVLGKGSLYDAYA